MGKPGDFERDALLQLGEIDMAIVSDEQGSLPTCQNQGLLNYI